MKSRNPWVDPRVLRVTVSEVEAYMTRHGWRLQSPHHPYALVFEAPFRSDDGQEFIAALPTRVGTGEYYSSVVEIIERMASFEERHPVAVLDDMLAAHAANGTSPAGSASA